MHNITQAYHPNKHWFSVNNNKERKREEVEVTMERKVEHFYRLIEKIDAYENDNDSLAG